MEDQPGTKKKHENRPGTMKNQHGTMKNQPATMKNHEHRPRLRLKGTLSIQKTLPDVHGAFRKVLIFVTLFVTIKGSN